MILQSNIIALLDSGKWVQEAEYVSQAMNGTLYQTRKPLKRRNMILCGTSYNRGPVLCSRSSKREWLGHYEITSSKDG